MSDWVPTLREIQDAAVASAQAEEGEDQGGLESYIQDCIYDGLLVALVEMQEEITGKHRHEDNYQMYTIARKFLAERSVEHG